MKRKKQVSFASLALCIAFASCSTTHPGQGNSAYTGETHKTKKNPRFIDGVAITPSSNATVRHSVAISKRHNETAKAPEMPHHMPDPSLSVNQPNDGKVQNMGALEMKYAVRLNVPVESAAHLSLLSSMEHWWATPYKLGGNSENGVDCSAFSQIILHDIYNATIPRTAQQQFQATIPIDDSNLKEGDLVFFGNSNSNITHVGIYVTNHKFVHASTSSGVMISDLGERYWSAKYQGAHRFSTAIVRL